MWIARQPVRGQSQTGAQGSGAGMLGCAVTMFILLYVRQKKKDFSHWLPRDDLGT